MPSPRRTLFAALALGAAVSLSGAPAKAASPEEMMAHCRERAHKVLNTRLPDIQTKYEGQRTDGTHAVNGTAVIHGVSETFQCSFNKHGNKIVHFVVNAPAGEPEGEGASGSDVPTGDEQVCLQAVTQQTNNPDVVLLGSEFSQANNAVMVGVGPQKAKWRCLVKNGIVAEVMSLTDEGAL
jgi:hypothetical protein